MEMSFMILGILWLFYLKMIYKTKHNDYDLWKKKNENTGIKCNDLV